MVDENFNDWASEATQNDIKKILEQKLKNYDAKKIEDLLKKIEDNTKSLKGSAGAGGVDFTKSLKAAELAAGGAGGGGGPTNSTVAMLAESFEKATGGTPGGAGGGGGPIGPDNSELVKAKEDEISRTKKVASGLFNFGVVLSKNTIGMISGVAVLGALGKVVGESIDGYRELMGVGQSFGGSMLEMRRQAAAAGMNFSDFSNIMKNNSTIIKAIGNTTFNSLQKRVRDLNGAFGQFGFTVVESAQATADYTERQIRAGRLEQLSEQQLAQETQSYMYQLTELSKITGRRRDEMANEIKEMARDVDIFTAQALLGAEGGQKFREGLDKASTAMVAVPGFGKALTDAAAMAIQFGNQGMSAFGRVSSIVSGELSTGMDNWIEALKRGESGSNHLATVYRELGNISSDSVKSIAQMARAGDEGAKSMMGIIINMQNMSADQRAKLATQLGLSESELNRQIKDRAAALNEEQKSTNAVLNVQSEWAKALGEIQGAILEKLGPTITDLTNSIADLVANYLPSLINGIKFVVDNLEWFVGAWAALKIAGFISSISSIIGGFGFLAPMFAGIGSVLAPLMSGILPALGAAFAAVTAPVWGIVAAVAAAGAGIWFFWDEIVAIGKGIGNLWSSMIDGIKSIDWMQVLSDAFSGLMDVITFIPKLLIQGASKLLGGLGDIAGGAIDAITGLFSSEAKAATKEPASTRGNVTGVNADVIRIASAKTMIAKDAAAAGGDGKTASSIDPTEESAILLRELLKLTEESVKQQTQANERAAFAQMQRDMQIKEQKNMGRNRSVGMIEAN